MKRFVRYFSILMVMLCLVSPAPLFAQGKVDMNKASVKGLKGIGNQKAKAKKGIGANMGAIGVSKAEKGMMKGVTTGPMKSKKGIEAMRKKGMARTKDKAK